MNNRESLNRMQFVNNYLNLLDQEGYYIMDLNMVEAFFVEDKKYHPSNIVFERNYQLQSIRSDWTRSILNYRSLYHLPSNKLAYYGPVIRQNQTINQAGIEIYQAGTDEIIDSIMMHFNFIEEASQQKAQTLIVNDEKLIDLYLDKYKLDYSIKELIYDKDISSLEELLGSHHSLYQLLILPVSQQFASVSEEFEDKGIVKAISQLKETIQDSQVKFILDLSFRSPQRYYNGFYFQLFLNENLPALSGGQYDQDAFGIAINLSKGGLI